MSVSPPPPARAGKRLVVPVDMQSLVASVRFDVNAQVAEVNAVAELVVDGPDGYPAFDLRQPIGPARWDGLDLAPEALSHQDVGAGDAARVRVVDRLCPSGSRHRLELSYTLATPDATGALPVGWTADGQGVSWDLWMSDLEPGRYLEMWLPAGLCHDRLAVELDVELTGTDRPHTLLANGQLDELSPGRRWSVRYPRHYTSLSPMLVLAPSDELPSEEAVAETPAGPVTVTVAAAPGVCHDVGAVAHDAAAWLAQFSHRYGPWAHGRRFLAVMWAASRGMEYDGATTACEPALEHEIFHSWFGRGVKPASANDGWIDEAMATWATASNRSPSGRSAAEPLGLDEPPSLLCPAHPWSRHTPREAYAAGSRLLSGVAHMSGGPAVLRSALASWHSRYGGRLATTGDLAHHLSRWCGRDLGPWWERYVYGGEPRPPSGGQPG